MRERVIDRRRGPTLLAVLLLLPPAAASDTSGSRRPDPVSRVSGHPAAWISLDGTLLASGAERRWAISRLDGTPVAEGTFDAPARGAVLARGKLYFDQGARIAALSPGALEAPTLLEAPEAEEGARLLLGRMHDYLLVVEQEVGIHLLTLPPPPGFRPRAGHRHRHVWPDRPTEVSFTALETVAIDVAAHGLTTYIALETGGVAVLDASDPLAPEFGESLPVSGPVSALAVNGHRLFLVGGGSLRVYDLRGESPRLGHRLDGIHGSGIELSGRRVHVAQGDGGLTTLQDESADAVTHFVALTNFEFVPSDITIEVGDTVQWDNNQGFHDTDSCDLGETGCSTASTETFDSGAPATSPWTFSHTFTLVGPNPYTCTVHAGIGMVGSVEAEAAPATPPAVPDGDAASSPLRVAKQDSVGSSLEVSFDDSTCSDVGDTQIVGAPDSDLPASPGGTYGIRFARCGCGTTSPCTWNLSPSPAAGQFVWFVMTATDGSTTEGLWGQDGDGNDRSGPAAGGSSGECGVTGRDATNTCGN